MAGIGTGTVLLLVGGIAIIAFLGFTQTGKNLIARIKAGTGGGNGTKPTYSTVFNPVTGLRQVVNYKGDPKLFPASTDIQDEEEFNIWYDWQKMQGTI